MNNQRGKKKDTPAAVPAKAPAKKVERGTTEKAEPVDEWLVGTAAANRGNRIERRRSQR